MKSKNELKEIDIKIGCVVILMIWLMVQKLVLVIFY